MKRFESRHPAVPAIWRPIFFAFVASVAYGQVVLFNEPFGIPGSQLNMAMWTTERGASSYLGRTQLADWVTPGGLGKFVVDSAGAQLAVNTYNPTGSSFYGTHAKTLLSFQPSSASTIQISARLRLTSLQPGIVYALYLYGCRDQTSCATNHDEIDLELVTNALQPGSPASVEVNSYAAEPLGAGSGQLVTVPAGFDALAEHEWSIQWSQQSIKYFLDGTLLFSRTSHVPSGPMQANIEAWVPDSTWPQAFSATVQPTAAAAQNQRFFGVLRSLRVEESGSQNSDPALVEYQVTGSADLEGITSGPDGAVWFAANTTGKIGRIAKAGSVTTYSLNSAFSVTSITTGPDGKLWFAGSTIGSVTTTGQITKYPFVGGYGIAVGSDGALWFASGPGNTIGRITTAGSIDQFATPTADSYPTNIVAGADGSLWFVEHFANNIGRITTAGVITEFRVPDSLSGITRGPDGAIWFTYEYRPYIGRITSSGTISELPVWTGAGNIITGPDGALWFTSGGNLIGRMNTATGSVVAYRIPSSSANPVFLCTGPDGAIWFTENGTGKVGRLSFAGSGFISGVANAASYDDSGVAPGETVVLFGRALGPAVLAGSSLDGTGKLATNVAGTQVLFDGVPAPIISLGSSERRGCSLRSR